MLHYLCKLCDKSWLGDPWCPECGKICKADPNYHGHEGVGRPKTPPLKWNKKNQKELYKRLKARKYYNKYR